MPFVAVKLIVTSAPAHTGVVATFVTSMDWADEVKELPIPEIMNRQKI